MHERIQPLDIIGAPEIHEVSNCLEVGLLADFVVDLKKWNWGIDVFSQFLELSVDVQAVEDVRAEMLDVLHLFGTHLPQWSLLSV